MMTLFAALSAGAKTYLLWSFSIFLFNDFTERLVRCLYKCGCLVKVSIRMSIIRRNSFFQSLRACSPTFPFLHHRLQYDWSASLTIFRHLVKSILDGSLYLGPFSKSDLSPLSWIQSRSPVTTWPAGGYRNGELHFWQRMLLFHFYYKTFLNIYYVSFLLGLSIYCYLNT